MKNGIFTLLFLTLLSCMPEEELPMKDMGEISGYFIECYCKPGEFYTLNAAKVSPIHEIIDLSDPIDLDVSIKADSIIKLIPTFSPSFFGNFRHDTKFNQFGLDSLYLSIYTPEKEHITAKTAIPDHITISSYFVSKATNSVTIGFQTSPRVKSPKPISLMAGIPFTNRNTHMSATAAMDTSAAIRNTTCIIVSLSLCIS